MPAFPANLQGLNVFATGNSPPSQLSDEELAQTLALWTNIDFQYDDGGIGLNSAKKLLEEDERIARENALADPFGGRAIVAEQDAHSQDPFAFPADLFTLGAPPTQQAAAASTAAGSPLDTSSGADFNNASVDLPPMPSFEDFAGTHKRKLSATAPSSGSDESPAIKALKEDDQSLNGVTAEEDKRRRNTAASARFRAKKKEREQALEKNARELQARCAALEREVETLKRENVWLKGLVIGGAGGSTLPSSAGGPSA